LEESESRSRYRRHRRAGRWLLSGRM